MRLFYVTLNTGEEARRVAVLLLERGLAVCCNWFPITCAYRCAGKVVEEPETVLIVKTQEGYRDQINALIRERIPYTQAVLEIEPASVNDRFREWLDAEIPLQPPRPPG